MHTESCKTLTPETGDTGGWRHAALSTGRTDVRTSTLPKARDTDGW